MSEQNILNPTASSLLNPQYGWQAEREDQVERFRAGGGKLIKRQQELEALRYQLEWKLDDATLFQLRQWHAQYALDFFTLADHLAGPRYYSGHFVTPLRFSPQKNNVWRASAFFEELAGLPLYAYPTNWSRDAIFYNARNGLAEDRLKKTGAWTLEVHSAYKGGSGYWSSTTNDTVEWLVFGYGFRFWSPKTSDLGIVEVSATKHRDGTVALAATNVDLYNATLLNSAALLTKSDLALDLYRIKLRVTGTKNASSSGFRITADSLEVMR